MDAQLSNRFNQARNRYIQAAFRTIDAVDNGFREQGRILYDIEERESDILENIYREIKNICFGLENGNEMMEPFRAALRDAHRMIDNYRRRLMDIDPEAIHIFKQAIDGYIEAAKRRIDAEFVDEHLNEIEDREYEIFRNIYADIRNRTHNIRPFMQILNDAEGTVEDYENTAMRRARDREAPAAGRVFGEGFENAGMIFGNANVRENDPDAADPDPGGCIVA